MTYLVIAAVLAAALATATVLHARRGRADDPEVTERKIQRSIERRRYGSAIMQLLELHRYEEASRIQEQRGLQDQAAGLLETAGMPDKAAAVYLRAGDYEMAELTFRKAGLLEEAAEASRRRGDHGAAAKLLDEAGNAQEAANAWLRAGDTDRAARSLAQAGKTAEAARLLAEKATVDGRHQEAARLWLQAGDTLRAAEEFREAGALSESGRAFMVAGSPGEAMQVFEIAGDYASLAEAAEQAGDLSAAARAAWRAGDADRTVRLLLALDEPLTLARVLIKFGRSAEAKGHLAAITNLHPTFIESRLLLADLERADGRPREAYEALKGMAMMAREMKPDMLRDALATMAEILLEQGARAGALKRFHELEARGLMTEELETLRDQVASSAPDESSRIALQDIGRSMALPRHERYRIDSRLGRGGNGVVYKAWDTRLDRAVVIKMIAGSAIPEDVARRWFDREARLAAQLHHPNIVSVFDVGQMNGKPFMAMEYVDGENLADVARRKGPMTVQDLLPLLEQVVAAVEKAHTSGIVHRDIKPENIMVARDGTVKLMDFGLAKSLLDMNQSIIIAGTPLCMAPEQIEGRPIDPRTDIYALGVLLFRLTTGHYPYERGNVLQQHRLADVPDPCQLNAGLSPAFGAVVTRAMAKAPEWRFPTVLELLVAVKGISQSARRSATEPGAMPRSMPSTHTVPPIELKQPARRPSTGRMRASPPAKKAPVKASTAKGVGIAEPKPSRRSGRRRQTDTGY